MAKKVAVAKIKVMVASTIYGYEDQLEQICATLKGYGYEVWNSHMRTIPVHPGLSNTENCLRAVDACDVFLGLIRPRYGAVPGGELSITHQEMLRAIKLKKPRWFIAHRDISIARQLLKQYMLDENGEALPNFTYRRTEVMDDIRLVNLYNDTNLNDVVPAERVGHWVDEFFRVGDILKVMHTQFEDQNRIREIVLQMNAQVL